MTRSQCVNRMISSGMTFVQASFVFHDRMAELPDVDRKHEVAKIVSERELVESFSALDEEQAFSYELTRLHRGGSIRGRSI